MISEKSGKPTLRVHPYLKEKAQKGPLSCPFQGTGLPIDYCDIS